MSISIWRRKDKKTNTALRSEMAGTEYAAATGVLRRAEKEQKLAEERLEKSAERHEQEKQRLNGMGGRPVGEIRATSIQLDAARREYVADSNAASKAGIERRLAEGRLRNAAERYRHSMEELERDRM